MANGRFIWKDSNGVQQSYTFPYNYAWNYEEETQDKVDKQRGIDGTMRSYWLTAKQAWLLKFEFIPTSQKDQFAAIKNEAGELIFYPDADQPAYASYLWTGPFKFREVSPNLWTGNIVLEEV